MEVMKDACIIFRISTRWRLQRTKMWIFTWANPRRPRWRMQHA
jgi:hypothetical protein